MQRCLAHLMTPLAFAARRLAVPGLNRRLSCILLRREMLSDTQGPSLCKRSRRKQETCYEVVLPRFILVFLLFRFLRRKKNFFFASRPYFFRYRLLLPPVQFTHSIKTSFSTRLLCASTCTWTLGERVRRREKGNQLNEYYFILSWNE